MLVNLSNHASNKWNPKQMEVAIEKWQSVEDLPFPQVPPYASTEEVIELVLEYASKVLKLREIEDNSFAVLVTGEAMFSYYMIETLITKGITCVSATSDRKSVDNFDGSKTSMFEFAQFREYYGYK